MKLAEWLDEHARQAPAALADRVREYAFHATGTSLPHVMAVAGQTALSKALSHPGDRSTALDLLAADALITLALLAQAETSPEHLEEFATSVLRAGRMNS